MAKYKVNFSGYAYLEADSEEDARYAFEDGDYFMMDNCITSVEEVDIFRVELT